ncbi:hypothetical protein AwErysi_00300 [Erysipelotrichaceae bacterium]|nr:hypothetical protein AwErysi_00300 [Erysipelotrichaceae bacterium]
MTISNKIRYYTGLLVLITSSLFILYYLFLFPSLYTAFIYRQQITTIETMQKKFESNIVFDDVLRTVIPDTTLITLALQIPKTGDTVLLGSRYFNFDAKLIFKHEDDIAILSSAQDFFDTLENTPVEDYENLFESPQTQEFVELLNDYLLSSDEDEPFTFTSTQLLDGIDIFTSEKTKFRQVGSTSMLLEVSSQTDDAIYKSFIGFTRAPSSTTIIFASAVTPKLSELFPIILESLPMLISISVLLCILGAFFFSKILVTPLQKLLLSANQMRQGIYKNPIIDLNQKDETAILAFELDKLYTQLREALLLLEEKNNDLAMQHEQQEMFLIASSHQLKTPISGALLLIDGMITKLGKYKNTVDYLPIVRQKIFEMRDIVDEVLSVHENMLALEDHSTLEIDTLFEQLLKSLHPIISAKKMDIVILSDHPIITTNPLLYTKVIENILGNAIKYSPSGATITITLLNSKILIKNSGITIPNQLITKIFEPFIRVDTNNEGHGLGLYIAANYARKIGFTITIANDPLENAVITTFSKK